MKLPIWETEPFNRGKAEQVLIPAGDSGICDADDYLVLAWYQVPAGKVHSIQGCKYAQDQVGIFRLILNNVDVYYIMAAKSTTHKRFSSSGKVEFKVPWKIPAGQYVYLDYVNGNSASTNVSAKMAIWEETA